MLRRSTFRPFLKYEMVNGSNLGHIMVPFFVRHIPCRHGQSCLLFFSQFRLSRELEIASREGTRITLLESLSLYKNRVGRFFTPHNRRTDFQRLANSIIILHLRSLPLCFFFFSWSLNMFFVKQTSIFLVAVILFANLGGSFAAPVIRSRGLDESIELYGRQSGGSHQGGGGHAGGHVTQGGAGGASRNHPDGGHPGGNHPRPDTPDSGCLADISRSPSPFPPSPISRH